MVVTGTRERKARRGDAIWGKGRARRTSEPGPDRRIMQSGVSVKSRDRQVPNDKNNSLHIYLFILEWNNAICLYHHARQDRQFFFFFLHQTLTTGC